MATLATNEITITFLSLFLLLASACVCGKLFELCKAPKVVGEIVGGMLMGCSCVGFFWPDVFQSIFNAYAEQGKTLNMFYQLGLVFLMFSSGFSTTIRITRKNAKNYILLFVGATVIPMLIAIPFATFFQNAFVGTANNTTAYVLVFLISTAITSIPVISKIFFDIDMMNTKFSNMVLTVSTLQDLCLWILLNLSISLVETGEFKLTSFLLTTAMTIGLLFFAKGIEWFVKRKHIRIKKDVLPIAFLLLFAIIYLLSKVNINIMYSAFIGGYIMKSLVGDDESEITKIKDIAFALFVPIYFALVGIQLDVIHNFSVLRFCLYFLIVFGAEFIGTVLVMWFTKLKKKTVLSLGITMNARGGPGIVLATTAYAYNIINLEFFTVLIITTMISSALAGYWLRIFKKEIQNDGD